MRRLVAFAILTVGIGIPRVAAAQYGPPIQIPPGLYQQDQTFDFKLTNQSMWGPGDAFSYVYQDFLGLSWDKHLSLGGDVLGVGLTITGATDGLLGLNVGASVNGGSVDVEVPGQASVWTDSRVVAPNSIFTLNTSSGVSPQATLHTEFASISAYADFTLNVSAGVKAEVCYLIDCSTYGNDHNIANDWGGTFELAAINRDLDGQIRVLGVDVTSLALEGNWGPVQYDFDFPNLETDDAAGGTNLQSSGSAQFLALGVDIPKLIVDAIASGAGEFLSGDYCVYDDICVDYTTLSGVLGPRLSIGQEFTFTSTPMVTFDFSEALSRVDYSDLLKPKIYDPATSWTVPLGTDIDFMFPGAITLDVTPTYWLKNELNVDTDLLTALGLHVELLKLGTPVGNIGPLYSGDWVTPPLPINIDDRTFSMEFDRYQGATFEMTATPEPSTWIMLGSGMLVLGLLVWRRGFLA